MAKAMSTAAAHVPMMMRAAAIDRFGGPDVLTLHVLRVPDIDADEVLIAVHTAGVGGWDADIREGWWPDDEPPRFPLVLGTDGSGRIAAVGSRVRRFAPGDLVYAYSFANPKGGFYAEYVAVAAGKVGRPPEILSLKEAGAVATTGLTAIQGVDDVLHVTRGEAVVIHGASGGVGSLALQFAKMRGARVLATASGKDGVAFVRRLGADAAADGRREDLRAAALQFAKMRGARVLATASGRDGVAFVRRLGADAAADGRREDLRAAALQFAPDGVDAVLAFAGGKPLTRLLDAVKRGGRVAFPNGVEPAPRNRPGRPIQSYDATAGVREFERLGRAIEAARLKVPIAASYPLQQASRAHQRLARGHVLGKIVLRIRGR
jgi:NADPH:quinone reductase-like Zn-dependent oxidoreductase